MTLEQLKTIITDKIYCIEDVEFLEAIYKILDYKGSAKTTFFLSPEQRKQIEISLEQIETGNFISQEELEKEEDKWLQE